MASHESEYLLHREPQSVQEECHQSIAGSLLPELLSIIFLYYDRDYSNQRWVYHREGFRTPDPVVRMLSQVCRNWRAAGLSSPSLWCIDINFSLPYQGDYKKWLDHLLERCHPAPLRASVWFPPKRYSYDSMFDSDHDSEDPSESTSKKVWDKFAIPPGWEILFSRLDRVGSLDIQLELDSDNVVKIITYLETRLKQPTPNLKSICIEYNGRKAPITQNFICYSLPTPFLNGATNLRTAGFRNIKLSPSLARQSLTKLTELYATYPPRTYFPSTSTSDWLDILEAMPDLKTLVLGDWQRSQGRVRPDRPTVELPFLTDFTLDRTLESCSDLLTHLRLPPLKNFNLSCQSVKPGLEYRNVQAQLDQILAHYRQEGQDRVELFTRSNAIEYRYYNPSEVFKPRVWITLTASFDYSTHILAFDPPISSCFGNFEKTREVTAYIEKAWVPLQPATLRSLLSPFQQAETLKTDDLWVFVPAFEMDDWREGRRDVMLNSLTRLLRTGYPPVTRTLISLFPQIVRFLRIRQERGRGVRILELDGYSYRNERDRAAYDALERAVEPYGTIVQYCYP